MMRTLFLQAPSFDGYDGGAGARYQMKREVKSFWYPTWLAQPAAMVEGSKLIDAPAHDQSWDDIKHEFDDRDLVSRDIRVKHDTHPIDRTQATDDILTGNRHVHRIDTHG